MNLIKKTGITILLIGLFLMLTAGVELIHKERMFSLGTLPIAENRKHTLPWSPLLGLAIMAAGAGICLANGKAGIYPVSKINLISKS
jgi:hypothetical protein